LAKNASNLVLLGSPNFSAATAGGKASALHQLMNEGFPVPPGFVIPSYSDLDRRGKDLEVAVGWLGGYPVAVRSSAEFEDLVTSSFAGQYATYLKITTPAGLTEAIQACRASGNNAHALCYLHKNGYKKNPGARINVLVQKFIDASIAGVVFSIHPHSGDEEHALVECCHGLGERLVSGQITPTRYVLRLGDGDLIEREANAEDVDLVDETRRRLCLLALELQAHFGAPQDIEWAMDHAGRLWILQSRPITRIQWRTDVDEFTTANFRDGGVAARVCAPLTYSLYRDAFQDSMPRYFTRIKLLPKTEPQRCWVKMFYGRPYWCASAVKKVLSKVPGYDEQLFDQDLGIQKDYGDAGPARTRVTLLTLLPAIPVALALEREYRRQLRLTENYGRSFSRFEAPYLHFADSFATIPDREFFPVLLDVLKFHEQVQGDYFTTVYNHANYQTDFNKLLNRISQVTGEPISSVVLMSGLRDVSHMRMQIAFRKLVETARQEGMTSAAWNELFADFLTTHSHHGDNELDISARRWGECPERIKQMVEEVLRTGIEPRDGEAAAREQFDLHSAEGQRVIAILDRNPWLSFRFKRAFRKRLNVARTYASRREQMREYSTRADWIVRRYALEAGRRLHLSGWLSHQEDVFMLHTEDLRDIAQQKTDKPQMLAVTSLRKLMYRGYRKLEAPGELGRGISQTTPDPSIESSGAVLLKGTGCSVGRVKALARVVTTLADCSNLRPREVLVTRSTDPAWTPVFGLVSGIVTEVGGLLSHGAVLGREYGLPTVLNVQGATNIIKTGQILEVDGNLGIVRILSNDAVSSMPSLRDTEIAAQAGD
jgi:phosphohistidine swiveling domain-containing protein